MARTRGGKSSSKKRPHREDSPENPAENPALESVHHETNTTAASANTTALASFGIDAPTATTAATSSNVASDITAGTTQSVAQPTPAKRARLNSPQDLEGSGSLSSGSEGFYNQNVTTHYDNTRHQDASRDNNLANIAPHNNDTSLDITSSDTTSSNNGAQSHVAQTSALQVHEDPTEDLTMSAQEAIDNTSNVATQADLTHTSSLDQSMDEEMSAQEEPNDNTSNASHVAQSQPVSAPTNPPARTSSGVALAPKASTASSLQNDAPSSVLSAMPLDENSESTRTGERAHGATEEHGEASSAVGEIITSASEAAAPAFPTSPVTGVDDGSYLQFAELSEDDRSSEDDGSAEGDEYPSEAFFFKEDAAPGDAPASDQMAPEFEAFLASLDDGVTSQQGSVDPDDPPVIEEDSDEYEPPDPDEPEEDTAQSTLEHVIEGLVAEIQTASTAKPSKHEEKGPPNNFFVDDLEPESGDEADDALSVELNNFLADNKPRKDEEDGYESGDNNPHAKNRPRTHHEKTPPPLAALPEYELPPGEDHPYLGRISGFHQNTVVVDSTIPDKKTEESNRNNGISTVITSDFLPSVSQLSITPAPRIIARHPNGLPVEPPRRLVAEGTLVATLHNKKVIGAVEEQIGHYNTPRYIFRLPNATFIKELELEIGTEIHYIQPPAGALMPGGMVSQDEWNAVVAPFTDASNQYDEEALPGLTTDAEDAEPGKKGNRGGRGGRGRGDRAARPGRGDATRGRGDGDRGRGDGQRGRGEGRGGRGGHGGHGGRGEGRRGGRQGRGRGSAGYDGGRQGQTTPSTTTYVSGPINYDENGNDPTRRGAQRPTHPIPARPPVHYGDDRGRRASSGPYRGDERRDRQYGGQPRRYGGHNQGWTQQGQASLAPQVAPQMLSGINNSFTPAAAQATTHWHGQGPSPQYLPAGTLPVPPPLPGWHPQPTQPAAQINWSLAGNINAGAAGQPSAGFQHPAYGYQHAPAQGQYQGFGGANSAPGHYNPANPTLPPHTQPGQQHHGYGHNNGWYDPFGAFHPHNQGQ